MDYSGIGAGDVRKGMGAGALAPYLSTVVVGELAGTVLEMVEGLPWWRGYQRASRLTIQLPTMPIYRYMS